MHSAFYGATESGKTTLARAIAREQLKKGYPVIVRDPVGTATLGGDWGDQKYIDSGQLQIFNCEEGDEEFYEALENTPGAHVFWDESGDNMTVGDRHNQKYLRKYRHPPYSLSIYLIAQRPNMVAPNARGQCPRVYCFSLHNSDMKELLKELAINTDENIDLDRGEFLILDSGVREFSRSSLTEVLGSNIRPLISKEGKAP